MERWRIGQRSVTWQMWVLCSESRLPRRQPASPHQARCQLYVFVGAKDDFLPDQSSRGLITIPRSVSYLHLCWSKRHRLQINFGIGSGHELKLRGNQLPECRQVDASLALQNRPACKQAIEVLLAQAIWDDFQGLKSSIEVFRGPMMNRSTDPQHEQAALWDRLDRDPTWSNYIQLESRVSEFFFLGVTRDESNFGTWAPQIEFGWSDPMPNVNSLSGEQHYFGHWLDCNCCSVNPFSWFGLRICQNYEVGRNRTYFF